MPNPLRSRPADLTFDHPAALLRHPEFAKKIAMIAASWQGVDNELASIFTLLLAGYEGAALEIFNTIIDQSLRKKALQAVAKDRLPQELLAKVVALFEGARRMAGRRNDVVHATWATAAAHPNSLIWVDPKYISRHMHSLFIEGTIKVLVRVLGLPRYRLPKPQKMNEGVPSLIKYEARDFTILLTDIESFIVEIKNVRAEVLTHVIGDAVKAHVQSLSPQRHRTWARKMNPTGRTTPKPLLSSPPEEPPPPLPAVRVRHPKKNPD
jgi:hypothetical protein